MAYKVENPSLCVAAHKGLKVETRPTSTRLRDIWHVLNWAIGQLYSQYTLQYICIGLLRCMLPYRGQ